MPHVVKAGAHMVAQGSCTAPVPTQICSVHKTTEDPSIRMYPVISLVHKTDIGACRRSATRAAALYESRSHCRSEPAGNLHGGLGATCFLGRHVSLGSSSHPRSWTSRARALVMPNMAWHGHHGRPPGRQGPSQVNLYTLTKLVSVQAVA